MPALLLFHASLPSGSSLGSLELPQTQKSPALGVLGALYSNEDEKAAAKEAEEEEED